MTMTPQEYIEAMGAGWNLGSCYDATWFGKVNIDYRYWCCKGEWQRKIGSGNYSNILVFQEGWESISAVNRLRAFSLSFTPTGDTVSVTLKHPVIENSTETLPLKITAAKVDGTSTTVLNDSLVFPAFSNYTSTLVIDLTTLFSESVLNKPVVLSVKIDSDNLSVYPTTDETVLSNIRKYLITRVINAAGFADVNQYVIKAVKAAGFKSIRIPIMWYGRCDKVDDEGHVLLDPEFLEHLATVLGWIHDEGMLACINMHHDDNARDKMDGWLTTSVYLTSEVVRTRYKDIWSQVADYFKDYGDWLSFASNNETLNNAAVWEYPPASDIYGLTRIQKDFYDVVRNSGGNNATRICIYPTYAAKVTCISSAYVNPDDSSDTGVWNIPYNDQYGICEIHPYADKYVNARTYTRTARDKGVPIIFGEYGLGGWSAPSTCQLTAYQVGYATYYHMGTFIWDDDGGMRILNRRGVSPTNYTSKSLWAGYMNDFIPHLIENIDLKETEILLDNGRQDCYFGDTVGIYLDTDEVVHVSNEGSDDVSIDGNKIKAGKSSIHDLLAISYAGEYNTIDIDVYMPEHWLDQTFNEESDWEDGCFNIYPQDGYKKIPSSAIHDGFKGRRVKEPIPVSANTAVYALWYNPYSDMPLYVVEYDGSMNMITNTVNYGVITADGVTPYYPRASARYITVWFEGTAKNIQPTFKADRSFTIFTRDTSQQEERDLKDSFTDSITDYKNFYASLYRTVNVSGGMEYEIDFGSAECDVYIREFSDTRLEAEYWVKNGDKFTTNLFTKSMRIEIEVPNANINEVITAMNNGALRPTLSYTDYATHQSEYDEEFTPIHLADLANRVVGVGNRLLSRNGKVIKI